jgi:hypothetical protein
LDKEREGIVSTVTDAVVETAKAGLDVAVAGLEVTNDAAVTAGTSIGEAVSSLATKASKAIRKRRSPKRATTRKKTNSKTGAAVRKTTRKTTAKKPTKKVPSRKKSTSAKTRRQQGVAFGPAPTGARSVSGAARRFGTYRAGRRCRVRFLIGPGRAASAWAVSSASCLFVKTNSATKNNMPIIPRTIAAGFVRLSSACPR